MLPMSKSYSELGEFNLTHQGLYFIPSAVTETFFSTAVSKAPVQMITRCHQQSRYSYLTIELRGVGQVIRGDTWTFPGCWAFQ